MNTVNLAKNEFFPLETYVELLTLTNRKNGETAFIGQCGLGPEHDLYLICYDRVVLLRNPSKQWYSGGIVIDKFVDLEINVVEKSQKNI